MYTVLCTIVGCGGVFFRGCPSTSAGEHWGRWVQDKRVCKDRRLEGPCGGLQRCKKEKATAGWEGSSIEREVSDSESEERRGRGPDEGRGSTGRRSNRHQRRSITGDCCLEASLYRMNWAAVPVTQTVIIQRIPGSTSTHAGTKVPTLPRLASQPQVR